MCCAVNSLFQTLYRSGTQFDCFGFVCFSAVKQKENVEGLEEPLLVDGFLLLIDSL